MDAEEELEEFPDVYELFRAYDQIYFGNSLGFASVEWSTGRMTMCAGVCCFNPGGETRIKLSEPLLKFRPVKDLKNTLLHEMIHAYMFLDGIRDRDSHGPKFQEKMHQINSSTAFDPYRPPSGYHITIYHTMIDEVQLYRVHHWRCEKCGDFIQRAMNRKPQPADCRGRRGKGNDCADPYCHYHKHLRSCGGQYVKIAGPDLDGQNGKGKKEDNNKGKKRQPDPAAKGMLTIEQAFAASAAAATPGKDSKNRGVKLGRGDQVQDIAGTSSPQKGQHHGTGKGKGQQGSKHAAPSTPPTVPITNYFKAGGNSTQQQGHATGAVPEGCAPEKEMSQEQQQQEREQHRQRCMEAALRRMGQSTGSSSKPSGPASVSQQDPQQQDPRQQQQQQRRRQQQQQQQQQQQRQQEQPSEPSSQATRVLDLPSSRPPQQPQPQVHEQPEQQQQGQERSQPKADVIHIDLTSEGEDEGGGGGEAACDKQQQRQQQPPGPSICCQCPVCAADVSVPSGASSEHALQLLNAHMDECLALVGGFA